MFENLEYARATKDAGIVLSPVSLETGVFYYFGDSSWANADKLKTQLGLCIVFGPEEALQRPAIGSIVDYRSHRSQRMIRSTLAGEAAACDTSVDHGLYI